VAFEGSHAAKVSVRAVGFCGHPYGIGLEQTAPKAALLALSKQDHTLAIVDPADLHVVARIPVGDDPHEVVASNRRKDGLTSRTTASALFIRWR